MLAVFSRKRSQPFIHQLFQIQRLCTSSQPSPAPVPLFNAHHQRNPSFARWLSAVGAGSALGLLYWSASGDSEEFSFSKRFLLSFADWSTAAVNHPNPTSVFRKLSLPDEDGSTFLIGAAYRRKVFFKYEKRIRLLSPPEKVFEYFASYRTPDGELLMRPADLMRALVPVFPPHESNLVRDGYLIGERRPGELRCPPSELFMLFDVNNDGLISFKEYIFFVTLLSIPESSFSVVFKMFDVDNSGEIDKEEFKKVMKLMREHNRQGTVHKDGRRTGLKVHGSVENGGLVEHFFGKDGKGRLQHDKFIQFLRDLRNEMLRLEFAHYDYKLRGSISAKDFAFSVIASAEMHDLERLLDRVDKLNLESNLKDVRITFEEFKNFAELRKKLLPLSLALFSYGKVNGLLTRDDFQRAATHVCGISLTNNVVDIIFHVFDSNCDEHLSVDEFVRVLHKRGRDISQTVESGVIGLI